LKARHWFFSWASWTHSTFSNPICLTLYFPSFMSKCFKWFYFLTFFRLKLYSYAQFSSLQISFISRNLIFLYLINLRKSGIEDKLYTHCVTLSSFLYFLHLRSEYSPKPSQSLPLAYKDRRVFSPLRMNKCNYSFVTRILIFTIVVQKRYISLISTLVASLNNRIKNISK
jgi:hypothetical protein